MNNKEKILLAIYHEYQKDMPNMNANVTFDKLQLSQEEFNTDLEKLENEDLINGLRAARGSGKKIIMAFLDNVKINPRGIHYVEQKLLLTDGYKHLCEEIIKNEQKLLDSVKYCRDHNMSGIPIEDVEAHAKATIELYSKVIGE